MLLATTIMRIVLKILREFKLRTDLTYTISHFYIEYL